MVTNTSKKTTAIKKAVAKPVSVKVNKAETVSTEHSYDIHEALLEFFGFDSFKGTQEQAINNLLSGKDTFVIMPTGGGKSRC